MGEEARRREVSPSTKMWRKSLKPKEGRKRGGVEGKGGAAIAMVNQSAMLL